ncbi:MAG: gamma-glutamyl-gamma-aminobutyrate hydrolase family protein, partial [Paenibacillus sp.]|uniref:gamma-glutamyl-gamma-aminobutyrate hydrolase family protein n=1 Tax=Paenibacillus sp. TaxID=58172 RepID=UPI0029043FD9
MKRPIIGVTPLFDDKLNSMWMLSSYLKGVQQGGGIPVILPFSESEEDIEELARHFDGFLFTGGQDVHPSL